MAAAATLLTALWQERRGGPGLETLVRGLVLDGVRSVVYRSDLAEPVVREPTDAVVAVRRAGLCGSDLPPYEGREAVRFGVVPGHEIVGEVVAVGREVAAFAPGSRVLAPFTSSCGRCGPCRRGLTARCWRGELFGFAPADDAGPALHGGQAELVRVPLADSTLVAVPDGVDDTAAVLLTDNLPTAWCAVERSGLRAGAVAVVVGLGAVGLCAVAVARHLGAGGVLAVDPVAGRRERARQLGAVAVPPDDAANALADLDATDARGAGRAQRAGGRGSGGAGRAQRAGGRGSGGAGRAQRAGGWGSGGAGRAQRAGGRGPEGAPSVVDAAGTRSAQTLAFSLVRAGGTLSVIAVQTAPGFGFTPAQAYDANVTLRFGRASVRAVLDRIMPWGSQAATALADVVITDPAVPLADGPATYRRFAQRADDMVKAVFAP